MPPKRRKIKKKSLGYNVYKARKAVKMTAKALADKVGLKVSYICDLERDKIKDVPADILFNIAEALDTTIAELRNLPIRKAPPNTKPGEVLHYRRS